MNNELWRPLKTTPSAGLTVAALGVVFGDIGTSPLYTMKACYISCAAFGIARSESAFRTAILLLAYTGAGRGECLALTWEDVDFVKGIVTIRRSLAQTRSGLTFKSPKNGRIRPVSIDTDALDALRRHRADQNEQRLQLGAAYKGQDLVFARPDGTPINPHVFGDAFRSLVQRADIPRIRLHDLRHTHITLLLKDGVPINVVSERVGHSSTSITVNVYGHVLPGMDREAADRFGAGLRKARLAARDKSVTNGLKSGAKPA